MPVDKPPGPPTPPTDEELEELFEEFEPTDGLGHVWIDGQLYPLSEAIEVHKRRSTRLPDLDEPTPVTGPVVFIREPSTSSKKGPMDWATKPISGGRFSLVEYLIGGFLTLGGGSLASVGVQSADTDKHMTEHAVQAMIASATSDLAADASVQVLKDQVIVLTQENAVLRAQLEAHQKIEAHAGALKRFGALETVTAVNLELMKVYHK